MSTALQFYQHVPVVRPTGRKDWVSVGSQTSRLHELRNPGKMRGQRVSVSDFRNGLRACCAKEPASPPRVFIVDLVPAPCYFEVCIVYNNSRRTYIR